jgi:MFS family permease
VAGGGAALGLLHVIGSGDASYAGLALASALPYLAAAAVVAGFPRGYLGPDHMARSARLAAREVLRGMVSGARHAWAERPAAAALTAIALHRFWYGVLTLMTLLLYRNTFPADGGFFPGGLAGLGEVVAAGAVGTLLAAVVTPWVVRRIGKPRWVVLLLTGVGIAQLALGLPFRPPTVVAAGLVLGFVAQAMKICVDTTLQETIDDDHRGRVFSVYDTLFNVTFVVALLLTALLLPPSGVSYPVLVVVGAGYLLTAALYAKWSRSSAETATERLR